MATFVVRSRNRVSPSGWRSEFMTGDQTEDGIVRWDEAESFGPRGTVVVLPGRGESADVYRRLGTRLAADAYRTRVVGDATVNLEAVVAQVKSILAAQDNPRPTVLVGSDSGALLALRLLAQRAVTVDALILAGLPNTDDVADFASATEEIEARASCPTHRQLLRDETAFHAGTLTEPLPDALREPIDLASVTEPALGLHGANDTISPLPSVLASYRALPELRLLSVADGRHDVLNAINHRSVAASLVLFLERLRAGAELPDIVAEVLP
jgi:alpha-beta hydrolase superfamily lysophospholipase